MKKLLYIPAVISLLSATGSFCVFTYNVFWSGGDDGTAALHFIFSISGLITSAVLTGFARD